MKLFNLIFALLLFITVPASAADKLQVGKAVAFAWTFTPLDIGIRKGIFEKHDLDIEIVNFEGDARMQQGLASGSIQLGLGSGPALGFMAKGVPAKGIAAYANPVLSLGVVVPTDSPIKSLSDLKGKRMGVTTVGSLTDWLAKRLAKHQGWAATDITTLSVGGVPSTRAAMETKQVDAAMIALVVGYTLEAAGEWRVVASANEFVDEFITHVVYGTDKIIADDPEVVERFLTALWETIDWMKSNREETIKISMEVLNNSETVMARVYDNEIGMFTETGAFEPAAMAVIRESFVEMDILDEAPADDVLLTTQFLPIKH